MSSCLSGGGGRAYRLESLDLEVIKSPSSTSWISSSSSPSSTLSESSNCAPLAISTRKPRTPRKRPNQTYNEAAAILSTAYPKIFPTKPSKFAAASHDQTYNYSSSTFLFEPSELLMPFQEVDALLDSRLLLEKPESPIAIKGLNLFDKPCLSPPEIDSNSSECVDEFDAESILDEEIGGGIESIMGNIEMENGTLREPPPPPANNTFCYGYPVGLGLGLGLGFGMRRESREMRNDHCDWWRFPCVNVVDVNPNIGRDSSESKKKKKVEIKKAEAAGSENSVSAAEESAPQGLLLKLNFDGVLNAWSDKASPFSGDSPPSDAAGNDLRVR